MSKVENKIEQKEYTVKWIQDEFVRFIELPDSLEMSEAVQKIDFTKAGVKEGTKVDVKIEFEDGDSTGTVVFMTKSKDNKEEPVVEKTKNNEGSSESRTLAAVSIKNMGILFTEEEKVWYSVADSVNLDELKKINKGDKVLVVISNEKKGKNRIITSVTKEIVKKEDSKKVVVDEENIIGSHKLIGEVVYEEFKKTGNSINYIEVQQQRSIEIQGSVNRAFELVASSLQGQAPKVLIDNKDNLKKLITELAEFSFKTIQDLKVK